MQTENDQLDKGKNETISDLLNKEATKRGNLL